MGRACGQADQSQSDQRPRRELVDDPSYDRDQRRKVDVAQREVMSCREEVQLVAIPPIARHERRRDGHQNDHAGNPDQERPARRALRPARESHA